MGDLMQISKFASRIGVSAGTVRRMQKEGRLKPAYVSDTGYRYFTEEQVAQFSLVPTENKIVIGYCRVSTAAQKDDLQTQINNVKTYMLAKGYQFEIITDIGSGINYNNKGLQSLISRICQKQVSKVVVLYKDRLVSFGFELIEEICRLNGCTIEIIDNTEKTNEQELCDDLIQIITVFANRLYGQRSGKTKQLIRDVKRNVNGDKNTTDTNKRAGDTV